MGTRPLTLQEINGYNQEEFVAALRGLFEGPPWIVAQSWDARPFATITHMHQTFCQVMYNASLEQKIALLQAHPDLVGRAALAGTLTPESTQEQASAGLNTLSPTEIATFTQLNQTYQNRFSFPFVICVRENKKASILAGFSNRLHHPRSEEIEVALAEVAKICLFRLHDLMVQDDLSGRK
jgi:OHCU decarboxylase